MTELHVDLSAPTPVYEQIRAQVAGLAAVGALAPGERLPASRALARDLGVAVGTVQRAYRELEAAGVVTSRRRTGTVVADRWAGLGRSAPSGASADSGDPGAARAPGTGPVPGDPHGGRHDGPGGGGPAVARGDDRLPDLLDDVRALVLRARDAGLSDGELLALVRGLQAGPSAGQPATGPAPGLVARLS